MPKSRTALPAAVLVVATLAMAAPVRPAERARHRLTIEIDPVAHTLFVTDRISLPEPAAGTEFLLNAALTVEHSEPAIEPVPLGDIEGFFGVNGSSAEVSDQIELARYRLAASPPDGELALTYGGEFNFGLSDQREEYTRGFRDTAGIIDERGVYLAGSGFWYPHFDDALVEFTVDVNTPDGWHLISQGSGSSRSAGERATWDSAGPMDEIYLVGGPLEVYGEAAGAVEALVYLRETDDTLAGKYLDATARYLEMYRELIGPYPYDKFALVENFWETGYGMPSFTLLGPRVVRFPFILHSSYPHEILHNWWGNSVFVDYATGNWCEGLTAYLADHLIQEQRGKGSEYRRAALQKYRDYVRDGRDFPLAEFRSRHSAATEAVGYGKTMMGFHMLRRALGDDAFRAALVRFYRSQRGRQAAFSDLRDAFEATSHQDLGRFFAEWVERPGAARLRVASISVEATAAGFRVTGVLSQTQPEAPFALAVPIVVQTASSASTTMVALDEREVSFAVDVDVDEPPLALHVDPEFDLFRTLDPRETPASIGQIFGDPAILAVLPAAADDDELAAYRALLEGWRSDSHSIRLVRDDELEQLPPDSSLWVLGHDNRFADLFAGEEPPVEIGAEAALLAGDEVPLADHTLVVVRRHPANDDKAIGWLAVDPAAAFPGLGRKLPHYGKYSYLGFEGGEPTNVVKGQWTASDSPLRVDLRPAAERGAPPASPVLDERTALAELPPVFSEKALRKHVTHLASPDREGRGLGSSGLDEAAEYIARQFAEIGLEPGGTDGGYFQPVATPGPDGRPLTTRNVVGFMAGTEAAWTEQSVIVSAHYDHLGRGWPDVHAGDEGVIHPGADDNASGVAVLLELARNLAADEAPKRSLIFVAFTGEEANRAGSRHFVERPTPFPLAGVRGVINLDTVGRLFDGRVNVLGTGTADEWQHIFRGSSFVTGVESKNVPGSAEASDQLSFIERGVPGVQIFTGAHDDYHRPGDTAEKIDTAGLVKVATFVKEAVVYMGERQEPLTVRVAAAPPAGGDEAPSAGPAGGGRRVRFGTLPDFAFPGPGVKVDSVSADSPAERGGFQPGDLLLSIDGRQVADLRGYSDILKTLEVGQTVTAVVTRGEERVELSVTVEAR